MRRIFLARHGETEWNALGKLQGHTDIVLNDVGRAQARALATLVADAGVATVLTSHLARARETGEIVATVLGLAPPTIDAEIGERRFGVFEGLTRNECAERYPEAWSAWHAQTDVPPGCEPREDAVARVSVALARIAAIQGGPVLVVSHGGVMRLWLTHVLGTIIPLIDNGTTYVVDYLPEGIRACRWDLDDAWPA